MLTLTFTMVTDKKIGAIRCNVLSYINFCKIGVILHSRQATYQASPVCLLFCGALNSSSIGRLLEKA